MSSPDPQQGYNGFYTTTQQESPEEDLGPTYLGL